MQAPALPDDCVEVRWTHDDMLAEPLICHVEYLPEDVGGDGRRHREETRLRAAYCRGLDISDLLDWSTTQAIKDEALRQVRQSRRDAEEARAEAYA